MYKIHQYVVQALKEVGDSTVDKIVPIGKGNNKMMIKNTVSFFSSVQSIAMYSSYINFALKGYM